MTGWVRHAISSRLHWRNSVTRAFKTRGLATGDVFYWARNQVDRTHSAYAAAQRVLEEVGDESDSWELGRGQELMALLREWDEHPARRTEIDDALRLLLRSLQADDCPSRE